MEGAIAEIRFFAGNFAPRGWALSLQTDQLPSHTHPLKINNSNSGMAATATGSYLNATAESGESIVSSGPALVQANPGAIGFAGGSQPVSIMPPYLGIIVIICLEGVFPSRN